MDKITQDAYDESITIYSLIRRMIDYYYENHKKKENEA